jgi:uncharacterized protein (DUF1810 family)
MIRHACHPRTVTTASLGVHGATHWGCLIAAASFPLLVTAGVLGAVSYAINLISVAPPTDQNLTAAPSANKKPTRYVVGTSIRAYPAHDNQALCVDAFHLYWAVAEMAHASGRRSLCNERLRWPAYRILPRTRVGAKANMHPLRQAASAATAPSMRKFSPPSTPLDLARFVSAQAGVFDAAMDELRAGRKRTHWMWFVFPQLKGLDLSPTAQFYGISALDEATACLQHPVLGPRLELVVSSVQSSAASPNALFGSPDDLKFCSSMTLFAIAGPEGPYQEALDRWCGGEPDHHTVELLRRGGEAEAS